MAPHHNSSIPCEAFSLLGPYTVYIIFGLCLALCAVLTLRRQRSRSSQWLQQSIEAHHHDLSEKPTSEQQALLYQPSHGMNQIPDLRYHDLLGNVDFAKSMPFNSGYFAAKADIEAAQRAGFASLPAPDGGMFVSEMSLEPEPLAGENDVAEQQPSWRRHSYPLQQENHGPLHDSATSDQTQHFRDDHDIGAMWRRRTLTFEGRH